MRFGFAHCFQSFDNFVRFFFILSMLKCGTEKIAKCQARMRNYLLWCVWKVLRFRVLIDVWTKQNIVAVFFICDCMRVLALNGFWLNAYEWMRVFGVFACWSSDDHMEFEFASWWWFRICVGLYACVCVSLSKIVSA